MGTRGKILIGGCACAAIVVSLKVYCWRDEEPEYGGRTLSQWAVQYEQEYHGTIASQKSPETTGAANAIRSIGTNAIPHLIRMMSYEPPRFATHCWASRWAILRPVRVFTYNLYRKKLAAGTSAGLALALFTREQAEIVPLLSNVVVRRIGTPGGPVEWWPPEPVRRSVDLMRVTYPSGPRAINSLLTNTTTPMAARLYVASRVFEAFPDKKNPDVLMAINAGLKDGSLQVRDLATNLLLKVQNN